MIITRETDYGIRIIRSLAGSAKLTVHEIADQEEIPLQFAYKILKKLNHQGLVSVIRGPNGGYRLAVDLGEISLMDVITATDDAFLINKCFQEGYECSYMKHSGACKIHRELGRIQEILVRELKSKSMRDILGGEDDAPPALQQEEDSTENHTK